MRRCTVANLQLAYNLRRYREAYDFTQQTLADRISISRQAYSNYETGKRDPDLDLLTRLCEVYSITLDQLVRQPFSPDEYREAQSPYHICYRRNSGDVLYLTDEELEKLIGNIRDIIKPYRNNTPAVGRKLHSIGVIISPPKMD